MKNAAYAIVMGIVFILACLVKEQSLGQELVYVTAILVGVFFISLFIVELLLPHLHNSVRLYHTIIILLLFILVFSASAEELLSPTFEFLIRFVVVLSITYIILLKTVALTIRYYSIQLK